MPGNKIIGYKKIFGFVLPEWVDERQINMLVGYFLVSIVMLFVLMFFVSPNRERINTNNKNYKTEMDKYTSLSSSKKSLDVLSETIGPNEQAAIFQSMPINYSPEEAVFELRNIAASSGVQITEYSLPAGVVFDDDKKAFGASGGRSDTAVRFQSFPVTVSVSGDINAILSFIEKVEKSLPLGFVSDLGIQEATRISSTSRSQTTLKLQVTYYQPIMLSFNLNNLQQFNQADLNLIEELGTYSSSSFQASSTVSTGSATTVNGSSGRNIFGL